jgi:hypothetical protein
MKNLGMLLNVFRDTEAEKLGVYEIQDAGWHFAQIGTPEQLRDKMKKFYVLPKRYTDLNYISKCKETLQDIHRPWIKYEVNNDMDLPMYIWNNRERFSYMFHKGDYATNIDSNN